MGLEQYRHKRDFGRTPEPRGEPAPRRGARPHFVVQMHAARRLHYDVRLEIGGVLVSWAVPKGPSLDPHERRLAVRTEDHPLEYAAFEGVIPAGQYGAGTVLVWDRGTWAPRGDPERGLRDGKLDFALHGDKLRGAWTLVRMRGGERAENWLLLKRRDRFARATGELVEERPESVLSGRRLDAVAEAEDRVWSDHTGERDAPEVAEPGRPETVPGARRAPLPRSVAPQLATLVDAAPAGDDWLHETKLDGYRLLCRIERGRVALITRGGNDWTARFGALVEAARALPCRTALLDGELVVLDVGGRSDFQRLQDAIARGDPAVTLFVFDLLHLDGHDLRAAALRARKEQLRVLVAEATPALRYAEHVLGRGPEVLREACRLGLEGIVSKRVEAPYREGRTRSWLKIKCLQRQELVLVGFTEPTGSRVGFGALVLGVRDRPGGALRLAGKVGTGFSERTLRTLRRRLDGLVRAAPPVTDPPRGASGRGIHWVEPALVAEVAFAEWTRDGIVRHATFRGLREDKAAADVVTERAAAPAPGGDRVAGVRLTHPEKVLYPDVGVTKRQLARYYEAVADLALPHLRDRPLTLLRCPDGRHQGCFFQKHATGTTPLTVPRVPVRPGEPPYTMIDGLPAVIALVQLGVLEFHVWGARVDRLDRPDLVVFDLDPAEDVPWSRVVRAARDLADRLAGLGLRGFARLTGGKGLHVVVPIARRRSWAEVGAFARGLAEQMVRDQPDRFTARMARRLRPGKIFIDHLRNARESTAIGSYSARARPGAPVALPVAWAELDGEAASPPRFSVLDVPDLVRRRGADPWADFAAARRALTAAILRSVGA